MARRRFFVDRIRHGTAELSGEDAQHLKRVLRAEAGEKHEISDGSSAYLAEIVEARRERVVFRVIEPAASPAFPVRLTLLAALVKFDRFEWTVEKATELGAARIVPFEAVRTEKGLLEAARKRVERWRRIARESAQQARLLGPPEVADAVRWAEAVGWPAETRYLLDEGGGAPLAQACSAADEAALLVGPEGGWTPAERAQAAAAGWTPASLGPQVLRAETAAVAGLAVLLNSHLR